MNLGAPACTPGRFETHHEHLGRNRLRGLDLSAHCLWHEEHNSAARGRDVQQLGVHHLRAGAWTYPYLVLARCITPNECVALGRGARGCANCWGTPASPAADDESIVGGSMVPWLSNRVAQLAFVRDGVVPEGAILRPAH